MLDGGLGILLPSPYNHPLKWNAIITILLPLFLNLLTLRTSPCHKGMVSGVSTGPQALSLVIIGWWLGSWFPPPPLNLSLTFLGFLRQVPPRLMEGPLKRAI